MHLKRSFAVIGGDQRQRCLLRQLHGLGFPASAYRVPDTENSAPELSGCLQDAAILILPMPALTGTETVRAEGGGVPLADILDAAEPDALVCGGMLGPAEAFLRARDISFFDYAKDETLLLQNAELTAEAALPLLLEQLSCPLAGSRILLCGFGRIGKLLARKLRVLGADVTVSARKAQDLELARILGFRRQLGRCAGAVRWNRQHRSSAGRHSGAPAVHPQRLRASGTCQPARRILHRSAGTAGIPCRTGPAGPICARVRRRNHPQRHIPQSESGGSIMKKTTLGLAMCGSFCTFSRVLDAFEALDRERFDLVPIMSQVSFETDSRFGPAAQFRERLEALCGREIVHTIEEAEPFGPKKLLDVLVIMPCTGNTLAKLASGIADGPVTLAAKAHLRNERPVIVAVSTNDGLAGNAANLGALLNRRGYYFVPFGQDSAFKKPRSLVADFAKLPQTVDAALRGEQLQPMLYGTPAG